MRVPFDQQLVTTGFLDTVNDSSPFSVQSLTAGVPSLYTQGVGVIIELDNRQALMLSSVPATFALYGGLYQYVQFKSGSTSSNAKGQLVFWDTLANSGQNNYVVTPDATSTNITQVAGITLGAVSKGNYGWIQIPGGVGGLATVLAKSSPTDATIGDIAFVNVAPANTVDFNTEGSITTRQLSKRIGVAYQLPVSATATLVWIQPGGAFVGNE